MPKVTRRKQTARRRAAPTAPASSAASQATPTSTTSTPTAGAGDLSTLSLEQLLDAVSQRVQFDLSTWSAQQPASGPAQSIPPVSSAATGEWVFACRLVGIRLYGQARQGHAGLCIIFIFCFAGMTTQFTICMVSTYVCKWSKTLWLHFTQALGLHRHWAISWLSPSTSLPSVHSFVGRFSWGPCQHWGGHEFVGSVVVQPPGGG